MELLRDNFWFVLVIKRGPHNGYRLFGIALAQVLSSSQTQAYHSRIEKNPEIAVRDQVIRLETTRMR
jgi:hypothetical protein